MSTVVRPRMGQVAVRPREDLDPTSPMFALPREYRLTAATDDVGVVEVLAIGDPGFDKWGHAERPDIKARNGDEQGDIMLVAFGEVRQGFVIDQKDLYIANVEFMFARLHADGRVEPLWDYIITKAAPKRFAKAYLGHELHELPAGSLSTGVPSGEIRHKRCGACGHLHAFPEDMPSEPVTHIMYEEVVSVGPGLNVLGTMRPVEWRPGELVLFSTDFAYGFRAGGESYHAIRAGYVLTAVDER